MLEIEIDEYRDREGMPKRIHRDPNKPYVYRRSEDLNDEQPKSDNVLGLVRARAKAIIIDVHGLRQNVPEVRIITGPKFDILIKLDENNEELNFTEELVKHVSQNKLMKMKNTRCISLPIQVKDGRFILDSGSGHDLISQRKAAMMNLKTRACDPVVFHTANGSTSTNKEVEIDVGTFDMAAQAYILDDTPSVTLGKRCMEGGYSCVWPSGQMPFLITRMGHRIDLRSHDNIPYIDLGTEDCSPGDCRMSSRIHEMFNSEDTGDDESGTIGGISSIRHRVHLDGSSGDEVLGHDHECSHRVK